MSFLSRLLAVASLVGCASALTSCDRAETAKPSNATASESTAIASSLSATAAPKVANAPDSGAPISAPHPNAAPARPKGARSTQSGVFTAQQATLGSDIYAGMCRSCHTGTAHTSTFKANWAGYPLSELYTYMSENMPKNDPGVLSPDEYTLVLAYLLQTLGMPPGRRPLPSDPYELGNIVLDTLPVR
jgi:mono/diheme cytochrome c family protein